MGVLSIAMFKSTNLLFFTNGLEKIELRVLDMNDNKLSLISKSLYNLKAKYYERLMRKDIQENYLFFRNSPTSVQIFQIYQRRSTLLAKFDKIESDKIVDYSGYKTDYLATLSNDGTIACCSFKNGVILRLPLLKEKMEEKECFITCSICLKQIYFFASTMISCENSLKQGRILIYKINQRNGVLNKEFVLDLKHENFSQYPNSFIKEMSIYGYIKDWPILVAFPHAGGSEMITFIYYENKLEHVKTISDYHTRSVISSENLNGKIWTLDGNGIIFSVPLMNKI